MKVKIKSPFEIEITTKKYLELYIIEVKLIILISHFTSLTLIEI